jgi:hypothetical protein
MLFSYLNVKNVSQKDQKTTTPPIDSGINVKNGKTDKKAKN